MVLGIVKHKQQESAGYDDSTLDLKSMGISVIRSLKQRVPTMVQLK